jgi:hypothetical protein
VGPLGESIGPSVGKHGECDVESRHQQCCCPGLYQLRTDGLAPQASIERTDRMLVFMGPVNQCSMSSVDVWLRPTASMPSRGEKLGGDPWIGQSMDW